MARPDDLLRFYKTIAKLQETIGKNHTLENCHGRMNWPDKGVYFFLEPGEMRSNSHNTQRVVRVGTHALQENAKSKLWNRLAQHKGTKSGGGNHRGSIFRLLVGVSIRATGKFKEVVSWGTGKSISDAANKCGLLRSQVSESESLLEFAVSQYIRSLPLCWVSINDNSGPNSERAYIEKNSIALLSNYNKNPLNPPSNDWLGLKNNRNFVVSSGLWNNDFVEDEYDPDFLERLDFHAKRTCQL